MMVTIDLQILLKTCNLILNQDVSNAFVISGLSIIDKGITDSSNIWIDQLKMNHHIIRFIHQLTTPQYKIIAWFNLHI